MNLTQHHPLPSQLPIQELTAHDEKLLQDAKAGSHTAFAELQNLYARRLYKRILSITRNHEDAEDALQDTFLRAYRSLPSFEGRSRFSSWLTRIGINSALMVLRKRRSRPEVSFELQSSTESEGPWFDACDTAMGPEQLYDQHQRCETLWRAIERLEPKARHALNVQIAQGNSMRELAASLGVSSASVKSRLHRARKRLVQSPDLRAHTAARASGRTSPRLQSSLAAHA